MHWYRLTIYFHYFVEFSDPAWNISAGPRYSAPDERLEISPSCASTSVATSSVFPSVRSFPWDVRVYHKWSTFPLWTCSSAWNAHFSTASACDLCLAHLIFSSSSLLCVLYCFIRWSDLDDFCQRQILQLFRQHFAKRLLVSQTKNKLVSNSPFQLITKMTIIRRIPLLPNEDCDSFATLLHFAELKPRCNW